MQLTTPTFSWMQSLCTTASISSWSCFWRTSAQGPALAVPPVYDGAELVLAALMVCTDAKLLLVAMPPVYDSGKILCYKSQTARYSLIVYVIVYSF